MSWGSDEISNDDEEMDVTRDVPPLTQGCRWAATTHDESGTGVLEVTYHRNGEQVARNVQPLQVDPGKFNYRLVRAELEFDEYGPVEAHCRMDQGPTHVIPYTLLPPA